VRVRRRRRRAIVAFDLEKLFVDVFAPLEGDVVTIVYDLPHGELRDHGEWQERRKMAQEWHRRIMAFSQRYGVLVNPIVTYDATGSDNSDLPEYAICAGERVRLEDILRDSTIILSMPQWSASAPLMAYAKEYESLRIASMPMVTKSMEETGLSADYTEIAATCARLGRLFARADGIEVTFSTGHTCHFDISDPKPAFQDSGLLHPGTRKDTPLFANLPAGEVCACPNEAEDSQTAGEIPAAIDGETIVFVVRNNQIVDIRGDGPVAEERRQAMHAEPALRNIAEVAIGCNDKAVVTGNILEDEKAGFHWAYGRSDHLGGNVGPRDFSSPDKVCHRDIVYAKGNPIVCTRFDFIFPDGTRETAIIDGVRCV
jgi:leucyl aminopeptidase (aminopeptidase T)